ncbi:MAG: hypothetical protein JO297_07685 [Nitrososphaeraceae archaeon]|nr:hypothetical protein [Nitrososphaeraceae archaeon]
MSRLEVCEVLQQLELHPSFLSEGAAEFILFTYGIGRMPSIIQLLFCCEVSKP